MLGPEHPDTLTSMNNLANAISDQGRYAEAEKLYREVLEIQKECWAPSIPTRSEACTTWPSRFRSGPTRRGGATLQGGAGAPEESAGPRASRTLRSMRNLAIAIGHQARYAEAEQLFREVLEIQKRVLGPEHPDTLRSMNNLAILYTNWCWQLATAADVSQRDPVKAVELANKAIELRPDDAGHRNNLGVAQYRAGDWQAAVGAFEKADAMIEGGDREHRMFLAMAHWQLGNQDKARELYAQGAAWMAANAQDNEEQQRFRAEAEQLMGITEDVRQQLIEQYAARPADNQTPAPPEPPHDRSLRPTTPRRTRHHPSNKETIHNLRLEEPRSGWLGSNAVSPQPRKAGVRANARPQPPGHESSCGTIQVPDPNDKTGR